MDRAFPGFGLLSRKITAALSASESVLFSIPRYCLGRRIVDKAAELYSQGNAAHVLSLDLKVEKDSGGLDYGGMWDSAVTHLKKLPRRPAVDAQRFEGNWKTYLRKAETPTIVLVGKCGAGLDAQHYTLLQFLHQLMRYQQTQNGAPFLFVALDDFSLWFHERYAPALDSEMPWMKREAVIALSAAQVECLLMEVKGLDERSVKDIGVRLFDVTGGHIGLLAEIWQDLHDCGWAIHESYWSQRIHEVLAGSYVLEAIRRDLKEDPVGLCTTALEFINPRYANEYESPRFQLLRKLGIIQGHSETELRLCGGAIKALMSAISDENPRKRVGTIQTSEGDTRFENGPLTVNDNEIVIVHLSDIHVGPDYAYRFTASGKIFNQGTASLGELLAQDLASQGIEKRVDGIVISGDITCTASPEEFYRARDVVNDILSSLELSPEKLVIIAGNHDVQWNAPAYAGLEGAERPVSREPFNIFLELLGKGQRDPSLTLFSSRDRKSIIKIIGIDSNYVEGPDAAGVGYVLKQTLSEASEMLTRSASDESEHVFHWGVVHHHVLPVASVPVDDARRKKVSIMGNASEILSWCREARVEVMLHGHEHQPGITLARRWMADAPEVSFWPVAVIGAGSCGAKRERLGPISHNQYYILIRRQADILVRSRVIGYEGVGFFAHRDLSILQTRE